MMDMSHFFVLNLIVLEFIFVGLGLDIMHLHFLHFQFCHY